MIQLIWKEFRELRMIPAVFSIFTSVLFALDILYQRYDNHSVQGNDFILIGLFTLFLAGILVGTICVMSDNESGGGRFIGILPVPWFKVWCSKTISGLLILFLTGLPIIISFSIIFYVLHLHIDTYFWSAYDIFYIPLLIITSFFIAFMISPIFDRTISSFIVSAITANIIWVLYQSIIVWMMPVNDQRMRISLIMAFYNLAVMGVISLTVTKYFRNAAYRKKLPLILTVILITMIISPAVCKMVYKSIWDREVFYKTTLYDDKNVIASDPISILPLNNRYSANNALRSVTVVNYRDIKPGMLINIQTAIDPVCHKAVRWKANISMINGSIVNLSFGSKNDTMKSFLYTCRIPGIKDKAIIVNFYDKDNKYLGKLKLGVYHEGWVAN